MGPLRVVFGSEKDARAGSGRGQKLHVVRLYI